MAGAKLEPGTVKLRVLMTTRQLQLIFPEKKITEKVNQTTSLRDRPRPLVTWCIVGDVGDGVL